MANTIYASFADASLAEKAAGALLDHGVRAEDMSLVNSSNNVVRVETYPDAARSTYSGSVFGTDTVSTTVSHDADPDRERAAKEGISTTTAADAEAGAAKGAGWGIGVGVIAGIASLMVPGVGIVLGGGALATALAGLVATTGAGAVAGAVTGYLKDQGIDEQVAQNYERAIQNGGAIIAVTVPSASVDETAVNEILGKYGAGNISHYATRGYVS